MEVSIASTRRALARRAPVVVLIAFGLLAFALIFALGGPTVARGLDPSWTEVLAWGFLQHVQVLLCRLDLGVAESIHHRLQVGAACEQPGRVGVPEVVAPQVEGDAAGLDSRPPDPGAGVAGDRRVGVTGTCR